ncbi:MAG TPA: hypothetical protein VFT12_06180, partial [Thermoanaerobaculia bacterium]|nr:hypothetical protein [Thermoanaerobaculia bacterium]
MRLFLALLVGLLIFLIAALLIGLARSTTFASDRAVRQWNTAADAAADTLRTAVNSSPPDVIETHLGFIRGRYAIDAAEVKIGQQTVRSGVAQGLVPIERPLPGGRLIVYFDASPLQQERRTFILLAGICAVATLAGTTLLFLYLPRITRPVELMLDQAGRVTEREEGQEDTQYVVET